MVDEYSASALFVLNEPGKQQQQIMHTEIRKTCEELGREWFTTF
jgi:hypothetical protein